MSLTVPNKRLRLLLRRKAASGQVVVESIASIIIFTIMISIVMSITIFLYFQQALTTAAREGARQASLNADLGSGVSEQNGLNTVETYIKSEIRQLTGQSFDPSIATITVIPPSDSASQVSGNRDVTVQISWKMKNPIGIASMLGAMGVDASAFDNIPVGSSATMRYIE